MLANDPFPTIVRMAGRHRCQGVWRNGFGNASCSVFERSGCRFASRKRVRTRIWSAVL